MHSTLSQWNSRVFQPIRKQKKITPHRANSTTTSLVQENGKKNENW